MAGPLPRQLEGPQQGDHLTQVLQTREHQTSVPERQEKHGEEEQPKPVPESPALHPTGDVPPPRETEAPSQHGKQLSPATVAAAVSLGLLHHQDDQWNDEAQQPRLPNGRRG